MELRYPINLIGIEDDAASGDVITRDGEFIGAWTFNKSDESGTIHFTADGESEPMFSEGVSTLDSGMLTGLAMSRLCGSIREWHESQT